jgi:hypothetical protein
MAPVVGGDSDEAVALDSRVLAQGDKTTLREIVDDACDKAGRSGPRRVLLVSSKSLQSFAMLGTSFTI